MRFLNNWKIDLSKLPEYSLFKQEFREEVDIHLARMILECGDERITPESKLEFSKLVERINPNTSMLPVKYSPRYGFGRRYADCPDSHYPNGQPNSSFTKYYSALISHPRLIKNTIFHYQGWVDLDQKKGHPTLLFAIAEKNHLDLPAYKSYLKEGNFEKIVSTFSAYYSVEGEDCIDKKDIKWLFNKTIYGGGHSKWAEEIATGSWSKDGKKICKRRPKEIRNSKKPHEFYTEFKKDTQKIIDAVYNSNPDIAEIVCKDIVGEGEEWKRKNRVMSYFCGIIENEITFQAYKYLVSNHLIQDRFCDWGLDGITFPAPVPYTDFDFHLNAMNECVRKKTGLPHITFVRKDFEPDELLTDLIEARRQLVIATPVEPVVEVEGVEEDEEETFSQASSVVLCKGITDDNEGAGLIYEHIKDRFKFCGGNIFFKENHIWVNQKIKVDNFLLHFILSKTDLFKMTEGKDPKPKPYSTNVSGARNLREALYARLIVEGEDNTLMVKFITTTKGRLCFLDGVLDFTEKRFYKWEDIDFEYYTPVQIERNFAEYFAEPDTGLMVLIKEKVFSNLFGVDCNKALAFFSRGVAGHFEDKAWSLYIGNRNCGKGVVDTLCKTALGNYHANCDAGNLLCNSNRSLKQEQPEKQMGFALDFMFARLLFTQELPPPTKNKSIKLNADIIKKLVSGGDTLKGKRNYDIFITEFINQSRLIVMANDCPTLTNDDALQTCCEFNSTISFKTQEEIDLLIEKGEDELILKGYKVGDPKIKDYYCRTEEWGNAFIMLMYQYYQDFAVPCVDKIELEPAVGECDDEADNKKSLRKFIITAFIITNNKEDFLKNEVIQSVFDNKDYGDISAKKIGIELKAIGLVNGRSYEYNEESKKSKQVRGWFGIKLRDDEVEDEEF